MSGKKRTAAVKTVDLNKNYALPETVKLVKTCSTVKFDETVELHIVLGIDPKQSDQIVRGNIVLPHGTGKSKKVVVITKGEKVKEGESSGADFVGAEDLMDKIAKGWFGFDAIVATPDMMKDLSKLGKILGPRGLMPNPKAGTVTFEIARAVKEIKAGRIEFRNDSYGIVHVPVGKVSFNEQQLIENIKTVLENIFKSKPATAKGQYVKSITISSTMGPGIKLDYRSEKAVV